MVNSIRGPLISFYHSGPTRQAVGYRAVIVKPSWSSFQNFCWSFVIAEKWQAGSKQDLQKGLTDIVHWTDERTVDNEMGLRNVANFLSLSLSLSKSLHMCISLYLCVTTLCVCFSLSTCVGVGGSLSLSLSVILFMWVSYLSLCDSLVAHIFIETPSLPLSLYFLFKLTFSSFFDEDRVPQYFASLSFKRGFFIFSLSLYLVSKLT